MAQAKQAAPEARHSMINLRGSTEYADWFELIHKTTHIPKAQILRLALAEWAANRGYPPPPEI